MSQPIRVLLADHNPNLRVGLRTIIEQTTDLTVVGEAEEGSEALKKIESLEPDVVVLDCELAEMSGAEVARAVHKKGLPTRVLALGTTEAGQEVLVMLQAGALCYLMRFEASEMVVMAVRAAAQGAGFFSPAVAAQMATWMRGARPKVAGLTQRETAVLALIAQGKSNKEIASTLGVKEGTVEFHVGNILRKLGISSRTDAAMWAKDHGLNE